MHEQRIRIMVVAQQQSRPDLAPALIRVGYELRAAAGAEDALELLHLIEPEVVLISIDDPVELCRRLRERDWQLPIVVLAPSRAAEDRVAALNAGADDCLPARFAMPELIMRLAVVRRWRPAAA